MLGNQWFTIGEHARNNVLNNCMYAFHCIRFVVAQPKDSRYTPFTPASKQNLAAEAAVMRLCYRSGNDLLADSAWRSSIIPEGAIVHERASGRYYIAVRVLSHGFWAWPAVKHGDRIWRPDETVTSLELLIMTDFLQFELVQTRFSSPIRVRIEDTQPMSDIQSC